MWPLSKTTNNFPQQANLHSPLSFGIYLLLGQMKGNRVSEAV